MGGISIRPMITFQVRILKETGNIKDKGARFDKNFIGQRAGFVNIVSSGLR